MQSQYDGSELEVCCPECKGEVAYEGNGYRCVEHYGIFVGCGWKASYESGIEPDPVETEDEKRRKFNRRRKNLSSGRRTASGSMDS